MPPSAAKADELASESYRALFEEVPISIWVQDFSAVKAAIDELRAQGVADMRTYLLKNVGEARRFARLVGVLRVNQRTVDLFDAGSEAALRSGLDSILVDETLPRFAEQIIAVAEGRTHVQVEGPTRTLTGRPLDIVVRWSVIPGHEDTYDRIVVSMIDMTALRNAERELQASELHFRAYFERAMIGMATTSPDRKWVEVNVRLGDILGYEPQELQSMTWVEVTYPEDRPREEAEYERVLSGQVDGYALEKRFVRKDGRIVEAHTVVQCARDDDGGVRSCVALIDDVTPRRQMERKILALNAELEQRVEERTAALRTAAEQLESFAYSVAHDLRTPLRAIDGYSGVLLQDHASELNETALEYVRKVRSGAERMATLIDDLLAVARASSGSMRKVDVDLSSIARFVVGNLRGRDRRPGIRVTIPEKLRAQADPGLAAVVLQNLLGNAWKYTAGVEHPSVELGAIDNGERVFFVKDNGSGFDEAIAARLFTPFERLQGRRDYEPGMGMGLATVERVVTRHGGRCWAEGAPGGGATFYFTLAPPPEQSLGGDESGGVSVEDATA